MASSLLWSASQVGDQKGRVVIVTGSDAGIGYETAHELAKHGAHVIVATRDEKKGTEAAETIQKDTQDGGKAEFMKLELASFRSIEQFVKAFKAKNLPLHVLVNNAGLQAPYDDTTDEGFEITVGVNYFGHFYVTQLLLDTLKASQPSRVVWVSSPEESLGTIDWDDLQGVKKESSDWDAYSRSKLFDLMAAMELNRRLYGTKVESFAVQPGMVRTDLWNPEKTDTKGKFAAFITDWASWAAGLTPAQGALPLLYASTSPDVEGQGGSFYGPQYKGPIALNSFPTGNRTPDNAYAKDSVAQAKLWNATERIITDVNKKRNISVSEQ